MRENRSGFNGVPAIDIEQLKRFYSVASKTDLIKAQAYHIERLQEKLATKDSFTRTYGARIA